MIIVDQERKTIIHNFAEIFIEDSEYNINGILARTLDGSVCTLGEFRRMSQAQKVFNELIEAYEKGLPVFKIPKE